MARFSKFSAVPLCALIALCATVYAQDSKPAAKPKLKASKAGKRLLFTVLTKDGDKKSLATHSYDLAKKTSSAVLSAPGEYYILAAISPKKTKMALFHRGQENFETIFADVKTGKVLKTQALKEPALIAFKTETRFYALQKVKNDAKGIKIRLIEMDIDGKNKNLIFESQDSFWDDVPLRLSPNGKYLSYFSRGEKGRGLVLFNIKTGKETRLKENSSYLAWSPNSKRVAIFDKGSKTSIIYRFNEKDDSLKEEKKHAEGSVITGWIDNKAYVVIHFKEDRSASSKIHGWGKDPVVLTDSSPLDDLEAFKHFDYDPTNGAIAYPVKGKDSTQLICAILKDGKVTDKKVIAKGLLVGLPYFVQD